MLLGVRWELALLLTGFELAWLHGGREGDVEHSNRWTVELWERQGSSDQEVTGWAALYSDPRPRPWLALSMVVGGEATHSSSNRFASCRKRRVCVRSLQQQQQ